MGRGSAPYGSGGGATSRKKAPAAAAVPNANRKIQRTTESTAISGVTASTTWENAASAEASRGTNTSSTSPADSTAAPARINLRGPVRIPRATQGSARMAAMTGASRLIVSERNDRRATASAAAAAAAIRHSAASQSAARTVPTAVSATARSVQPTSAGVSGWRERRPQATMIVIAVATEAVKSQPTPVGLSGAAVARTTPNATTHASRSPAIGPAGPGQRSPNSGRGGG